MSSINKQFSVHWLTGQFRDVDQEAVYRRSVGSRVRLETALALVVAALIYGMFAIADYQILGLSQDYYRLITMRAVVVGLCLILAVLIACRHRYSHETWLHAMPLWILATGIILIVPLRPDSLSTQVTAVVVATMAFYLLIPNRLTVVTFASLYLSIGFLISAALFADAKPMGVVRVALLLIMANGVGFFALLRLEKLQRRQFFLLHEERDQNRQLLGEIAHRELLEEQLRRVAERDALTGLNSRRHFMKLAEALLQVSRVEKTPFSLFMIDVDHFKRINDTWGHSQGDWVLARISEVCAHSLRPTDVIGRFGGEEFVVALPDTGADGALRVAERLRKRVAELPADEEMRELRLSITIGVAVAHGDEIDLQALITRADRALYVGKREGRDRVVACGEGSDAENEDSGLQ
ncbi:MULTISPECIES: GGDEF domain-containing protein [unclassified Modicisalibacter]|uniref:GGDEF domain-containing protein n=1 Tax=unclassified Modicisalibacter TaxID=2679913 RepID=UPI001CC9ACF7|nr:MULTISPECIES: GGDEF domain-containing protein [unclassified Modicisalibacter]MBZ9559501.1 GGDEF domain-containing protein [Modicisalibacter sp. R2A 31.J]MBZ9576953.1 GGDEF domain-containing protein [Modicisalibacter sp. MOD 31.J]